MTIATDANPQAAVSKTVSENSARVSENSGELNQIVLQFPCKSAIFLALYRMSKVALRLCLPAQQAP
jgi:hypothetical protein